MKKINVLIGLICVLVLFVVGDVYAQGYVFGPNVRVSDYHPGSADCYTPHSGARGVAVRADTVYCIWSDDRAGRHNWFAKSTDGGQSWLPNVRVDDGTGVALLPTIAAGNDGTIYAAWAANNKPGIPSENTYFSKSTDGGITFTPEVIVNDTAGGLKNHVHINPAMIIDSSGVIYITFNDSRNGPPNYDIYFSKSMDGGVTFTEDVLVNDTIPGDTLTAYSSALAVSNDGDIYVSFSREFKWLYVSKSTDGGISFSPDVQVNDTVTGSSRNSMDVDSRGYVHVCWRDWRDGNANIYYSRSTDGGLTFSPNIRVNDAAHEPVPQINPSMCVDDSGIVYAVWEQGPTTHPDIYFAMSVDTSNSAFVEPNVKVSDVPPDSQMFRPSIAIGDSGKVCVLWSDSRFHDWDFDAYFAVGKYESGIEEGEEKREERRVSISAPFPNPFTDRVEIKFCIGQGAKSIELNIYDISGRLVRSFPSSLLSLRSSVTWDGRDESGQRVAAGIYFVRGRIGNQEVNEKLVKINFIR